MKTTQILKRDFMGGSVEQNHKDGFFCINDLTIIANNYRKNQGLPEARWDKYKDSQKTKEYFKEVMDTFNEADVIKTKRGKGGKTWVHPYILIDYMMWLNPKFKVQAIGWVKDELTKYRDLSGDSFNKLRGKISKHIEYLPEHKQKMVYVKIAQYIKNSLGVEDWNNTTELKHKQRDAVHNNFILLIECGINVNQALQKAVEKALEIKE